MTPRYIAMDIGCIECEQASEIKGLYETREDALRGLEERPRYYRGALYLQVFDLETGERIWPGGDWA